MPARVNWVEIFRTTHPLNDDNNNKKKLSSTHTMIFDSADSPFKSSTVKHHCDSHETKLSREDLLKRISKKRWNISTGDVVEFPPLNCRDDLAAWVARVEGDLMTGDVIPRSQWADAAILYLADHEPLNMLMRQQRARRMEAGGLDIWMWEDFQESLSQVLGKVPNSKEEIRCLKTY